MQEWGTASRVWIPRHHGPGEHNYESAISFPELDSKCLPCPPKPGNGRSGLSFHVLALQNIPTLWKPAVEGKCNFSDMRVPSKGSCTHSFIPGLFRAKQALDCQAREAVLPLPWMTSGVPVRCWETRPGKLCPHFHGWRPKGWPSPGAPGLVSCATFSMGQPVSGMSGLGTCFSFSVAGLPKASKFLWCQAGETSSPLPQLVYSGLASPCSARSGKLSTLFHKSLPSLVRPWCTKAEKLCHLFYSWPP